jgi:DNA-binding transcriptional ArsR family regulator
MTVDRLTATFSALADPTRRAILARLASGEASVSELCEPFEISPPAITKHLKVLERAGLISRSRQAQWRPCKLEAQPLQDISNWVEQYRRLWEQRLDRLEDYLKVLQTQQNAVGIAAAPASKKPKTKVETKAAGTRKSATRPTTKRKTT